MSETNLVGILLEEKLITADSKSMRCNLISIYRNPNAHYGMIELSARTLKLFEEKVPNAAVDAASVMKSSDVPRTSGDIAMELIRIEVLLRKITAMKQPSQMRQALRGDIIGPESILIFCSQLKIAAPPNDTNVDSINLNAGPNHMAASLADTYQRISKINKNPSSRAKRSAGTEETIHVRRLTIKSDSHPFKGWSNAQLQLAEIIKMSLY